MLAITQQVGYPHSLALGYNNLGVVSYTMGYLKEALNYYHSALLLRKQIGDNYGVAQTHSNMGEAYLSLSQYDAARRHLEQAIAIYEAMKSEGEMPEVHRLLAEVELRQANLQAALDHAERARQLARQIGNVEAQGIAERVWGRVQAQLGDQTSARHALALSLDLLNKSGNQIELARTYYDFGLWWAEQAEGREAALNYLRRAASLFAAAGAEKESNEVNLILNQSLSD
jgi:tetratricopeptide (TPR) repeat protein